MRIAIDASNLRGGGGISHLTQLLGAADPARHGFSQITVFAGAATLAALPSGRDWLKQGRHPWLDGALLHRTLWRRFALPRAVQSGFDLVFAPGGLIVATGVPTVTMSQNMLPFEARERRQFPWGLDRLRLEILRRQQGRAFETADGVIYLTDYARETIGAQLARPPRAEAVVPHGISERFRVPARQHRPLSACSAAEPFRLLYVSSVHPYKHQATVVAAAAGLISAGVPVALDLVGGGGAQDVARLDRAIAQAGAPAGRIRNLGKVPFETIDALYRAADGFVFASSVENMPNILLEAMSSRLPILCSNMGPMPGILGDAGVFFDPYDPAALQEKMARFVADAGARAAMGDAAAARAAAFNWSACADETFGFLLAVAGRA